MIDRLPPLLHAASAIVLGTLWFSVLVTLWSTGIGMVVTLLGLPVIWFTLVAAGWMARVEVTLARTLLGANASPPVEHTGWALMTRLRDGSIWRAQLYLLLRFVLGLALGSALLGLVVQGLGLMVAPLWYWAVPGGIDFGIFAVDTLGVAFAVIPLGAVVAAAGLWLAGPYGELWRGLAERLLSGDGQPPAGPALQARTPILAAHAVTGVCILVWAFTGEGYFWPAWVAIGAFLAAGTAVAAIERSKLIFDAVLIIACFVIWAITGAGYLWPVWVVLGVGIASGIAAIGRRSERIAQLTETRAEVVGAQEDELRRIERDLHDGAQARLVSLAMSLGLAESRLDEDPDRARELMAEAQDQARSAIKELRDLARGIAPPVLQDRGLTAAIRALTATSTVKVTGDGARYPAAIERAGYFVAAEALTNAAKHAGAKQVWVGVFNDGDRVIVAVRDDGRGGANPRGSGLDGLRRRVEAVDGRLDIESSPGGTTVRASLPCASS